MPKIMLALAAAAAMTVIAGSASAVTDTTFTYSAFKEGTYAIHAMAMAPANATAAAEMTSDWQAGLLGPDAATACYMTGVNLPQGAWIYSVEIAYRSTDANTNDVGVFFLRDERAADHSVHILAANYSSASGIRVKAVETITNAGFRLVRNDLYAYGFGVCLGASDKFEGAYITYHYNSAGD